MKLDDYRGKTDGRQGRKFTPLSHIGYTKIKPLTFLHGRKWNSVALAYIHALRPSHLRVVAGGGMCQLDAQTWRVTVLMKSDGETIDEIHQEVEVGLPDGVENGYGLDCELHR